jgi:PIN domain nuclease of toxin-antitoxin system
VDRFALHLVNPLSRIFFSRRGEPSVNGKIGDRVVLDTHAVFAWLNGERGADRVAEVLHGGEPWMTVINLGEIVYIVERGSGKVAADEVYANLLADARPDGVPIQWLPVDAALVRRAASLKAAGGLSYADCFAAAAASVLDCSVLTGDPEFAAAERAGIAVEWL